MEAVAGPQPHYAIRFDSVRNFCFFSAVVAMIYTLLRPSPTDLLICVTAFMCLFVNQRVGVKFFLLLTLLLMRLISIVYPSIPYYDDPDVRFQTLAHIFVYVLALTACWVSSSWDSDDYNRFIRVYVGAATTAAALAMTGFIFQVPFLVWDERGTGFFDDPNMYGAFVVPSVLCCIYVIHHGLGRKIVWVPLALFLTLGVLMSFSRAASVGMLLATTGYLTFLNRTNMRRFVPVSLALIIGAAVLFGIAYYVASEFAPEMLTRLTVAKEYDKGHFGRYSRYALSIPMILDNPKGLGLDQQMKYFPEPIHNIFLSAFLNYGWFGGFVWLSLFASSLINGIANYRFTRNPLAVLLIFCYMGPILSTLLHEGEQWRHLWLFTGLIWGFRQSNFIPAPVVEKRGPLTYFSAELPRAARIPNA
jgi:hypothetical protein